MNHTVNVTNLFMRALETQLELLTLLESPNKYYSIQIVIRWDDEGLFVAARYDGFVDEEGTEPNGDVRHAHVSLNDTNIFRPSDVANEIASVIFPEGADHAYLIIDVGNHVEKNLDIVPRRDLFAYIGHVVANECGCNVCSMMRPLFAPIAKRIHDTFMLMVDENGARPQDMSDGNFVEVLCERSPVSSLEWAMIRMVAILASESAPLTGYHLQKEVRRMDPSFNLPNYEQNKRRVLDIDERHRVLDSLKDVIHAAVRMPN